MTTPIKSDFHGYPQPKFKLEENVPGNDNARALENRVTQPRDANEWVETIKNRAFEMIDAVSAGSSEEWQRALAVVKRRIENTNYVYAELQDGTAAQTYVNGRTVWLDMEYFWDRLSGATEVDPRYFNNLAAVLLHEATHNAGVGDECSTDTVPDYVMKKLGLPMDVGYHCNWDTTSPPFQPRQPQSPSWGGPSTAVISVRINGYTPGAPDEPFWNKAFRWAFGPKVIINGVEQ